MKNLLDFSKQKLVDEVLRTGKEYELPDDLKILVEQELNKRLKLKEKITKSEIKDTIKYIRYTNDLKKYVSKQFFDSNFYGFPLELLRGFHHFIDTFYEQNIYSKFQKSKKLFRNFQFDNRDITYNFISTTISLHFYITLLKYKSKIFLLLYDTESHHLHFALPISQEY
jgi:hypothetical protein